MMLKSYQETFTLRTCDCDFTGDWRPGAILTTMQEIAGTHSNLLGCGRDELLKNNTVWVLTRCEIRMDAYPRIGDTVTAETYPTALRRWFFPRYYLFRSQEGKLLGYAATLWVLMDFVERKMLPPGDVAKTLPDNSDFVPPMGLPGTVEMTQGEEKRILRRPVYFDLDVNQHVNNTRYADWACDALGVDAMREYCMDTLRINYEAEILPDQEMELHLSRQGDRFYMAGVHQDKRHFEIDGTLKKRTVLLNE